MWAECGERDVAGKFPVERAEPPGPSTHPAGNDAVVTVRSNQFWIASTQVRCFSCIGLTAVLGLVFPADSAIEGTSKACPPRTSASIFS